MRRLPKTVLALQADETFSFSTNHLNPFLHPFDHPEDEFFLTTGRWEAAGREIRLTSRTDSLIYPLVDIKTQAATDTAFSYFTFFDTYDDPVKVLYVQYTDSSIAMRLHQSMDYFRQDLRLRDTLEFHFYGYRPFLFISGTTTNYDYRITLKPVFRPGAFNQKVFLVKRNRLIDRENNTRFRKTK